jgi:hypothetical protein
VARRRAGQGSTWSRRRTRRCVEEVTAEWRNLYGAIVYAVNASLVNGGQAPLHAIRVRVDLLDGTGAVVRDARRSQPRRRSPDRQAGHGGHVAETDRTERPRPDAPDDRRPISAARS